MMETLVARGRSVREGIGRTVIRNLKVMARMGTILEDAVRTTYPEFPLRSGVLSWEDYLPPLNAELRELAERYDNSAFSEHSTPLRDRRLDDDRDLSKANFLRFHAEFSRKPLRSAFSATPIASCCAKFTANHFVSVTGGELLGARPAACAPVSQRYALQPGDRVALLAPNSIRWIAVDLALMAEGAIVVPLYYAAGTRRTRHGDEGLSSRVF